MKQFIQDVKNFLLLMQAAQQGKKIITEEDGSYTIVVNS